MVVNALTLKTTMLQILDKLPAERIAEVVDFALFLSTQQRQDTATLLARDLPTVPATHLAALTGLVAWGGDAIADTERLYEL